MFVDALTPGQKVRVTVKNDVPGCRLGVELLRLSRPGQNGAPVVVADENVSAKVALISSTLEEGDKDVIFMVTDPLCPRWTTLLQDGCESLVAVN